MSEAILFNSATKSSIDLFLRSPASACALIGARGSGKTFAGKYIAQKLIGGNIDANPNFIVLDAGLSGIEEVRLLQKKLTLSVPGTRPTKRVVLIEHFDSFGHEAQNALLKTLEEPPLDTVIIITVDHSARVLETIYSRVRSLFVRPVTLSEATEAYEETYTPTSIEKAFRMSGGTVGLMSSLLASDESHELVKAITKSREILSLPKHIRIAKIDSVSKDQALPTLVFLDGLTRLLEASYSQAIISRKPASNLRVIHERVEFSLNAIADIESGLNQKLALTRLFVAL